jgi:hypothetical protein
MVELYLHSAICLLDIVLNKHRDNFTFTSDEADKIKRNGLSILVTGRWGGGFICGCKHSYEISVGLCHTDI